MLSIGTLDCQSAGRLLSLLANWYIARRNFGKKSNVVKKKFYMKTILLYQVSVWEKNSAKKFDLIPVYWPLKVDFFLRQIFSDDIGVLIGIFSLI